MERTDPRVVKHVYLMVISAAFATTIAVFLHTLKFRKLIGPRKAFVIYAASYLSTFYSYYFIFDLFWSNRDLAFLTFVGLVLNFSRFEVQMAWQVVVFYLLSASRNGVLPDLIKQVLPLPVGQANIL